MAKTKTLQAEKDYQKQELSMKDQRIARLSSKMIAVRQIASQGLDDDPITTGNTTTTVPIIVKVESVESDYTDVVSENGNTTGFVTLPVNVCNECDKKFANSSNLKRHMSLHSAPTIPCPKCPLKFPRNDYMQKHFRSVHTSRRCPMDGLRRNCRMKTVS